MSTQILHCGCICRCRWILSRVVLTAVDGLIRCVLREGREREGWGGEKRTETDRERETDRQREDSNTFKVQKNAYLITIKINITQECLLTF